MSRLRDESTQPPAKALIVPRITPITTVMIVAVSATKSEIRAPKSNIIAMSVPVPGSTPSGWDQLIPELSHPKGSPPVDMSSSSTLLLVGLSMKKLAIGGPTVTSSRMTTTEIRENIPHLSRRRRDQAIALRERPAITSSLSPLPSGSASRISSSTVLGMIGLDMRAGDLLSTTTGRRLAGTWRTYGMDSPAPKA